MPSNPDLSVYQRNEPSFDAGLEKGMIDSEGMHNGADHEVVDFPY